MGYSNFKTLKQTLKKLQLEETDVNLFAEIIPVEPSEWLIQTLAIAEKIPLTNEKSKSERIISNILVEVVLAYQSKVTLYSGEELYVDEKQDLAGACDFIIAKHQKKQVMQTPIITLAEAKNENFNYGQGQCLAQMYAAQIFNEIEGHPQNCIYGCAVTGDNWKFLKLVNNQAYIDNKTYYLNDLPKILGIFHQIIDYYLLPS